MDDSRFTWETVTVDVGALGVQQRLAPGGVTSAISSGAVGFGAGGPAFLDQFRSKRAPTPVELVEQFKAIAFGCMILNIQGVVDTPLRLYCVTRPGDGKPRRNVASVPAHRRGYMARHRSLATIMSGANDVNEVIEHPFIDALNRPNPFFDGSLMIAYFAACLDCLGRFYLYPDRPGPEWAAREWWPLQPQYVMPIKSGGATILEKYTYLGQDFAPDELEGGRFLSLRDPYLSGMSPMQACYEQLGLTNYYTSTIEDTLKNGARPSAMIGPKDNQSSGWLPEQRARLEQDINSKFARGGQGRIWVVDGTFDFKSLSHPPADLAGLEINQNARLLIHNCFGVPISLSQTEDSNRAVAEAGEYQHQKRAIRPRCTAIASALTAMAQRVDPRLFFCFDNPVEADEERRAKIQDTQIKNGRKTINEIRDEDGEPPVKYGDEPWFSGASRQPSMIATVVAETIKKLQAPPKPIEAPPGEAPAEKPTDKPDQTDDEERSLNQLALRVLTNVEADQLAQSARAARARSDREVKRQAAEARSRTETAEWQGWSTTIRQEPSGQAAGTVQAATEGSAGDHTDGGDRAAQHGTEPEQRQRQVGERTDTADRGVLGRLAEENPEPTGGQDGPAERSVGRSEGDEPQHPGAGVEADVQLLCGDERDDEADAE